MERTEKWNINPDIRLQMFLHTKIYLALVLIHVIQRNEQAESETNSKAQKTYFYTVHEIENKSYATA